MTPAAAVDVAGAHDSEDSMRVLVVGTNADRIHRQASREPAMVTVGGDSRRGRTRLSAEFDIIRHCCPDERPRVCKARSQGVATPVLLLTARDEIDDKVAGLDAGADDYLTKPFAFSELLARTRALLRRPPLQSDEVLRLGELEIDLRRRSARLGSHTLHLSSREFALLEYLLRHPGQVLTRTQIGEGVWGLDFENESNVVDVYIGYLRRKLTAGSAGPAIRTVRGVGYSLVGEAD
jgi:DNA-binding response OmpR family regulator